MRAAILAASVVLAAWLGWWVYNFSGAVTAAALR